MIARTVMSWAAQSFLFLAQGLIMFRFPIRLAWICACLGLVLGTSTGSAAQAKKGKIVVSFEGELPVEKGTEYLKKEYDAKRKTFDAFVTGANVPGDNKQDQDAIKIAAQWYTYRLTWKAYQEPLKKTSPSLKTLHHDLNLVLASTEMKADKKFLRMFTRQLMASLTEVLKRGNLPARINGAIMLPRLCQTGQHELIDDMVAILKNPDYSEAIKLYAIKGLGELFQKPYPVSEDAKEKTTRQKRFTTTFEALLLYLDPKLKIPAGITRFERRQIQNATRFFRREAIRALGQMHVPAVSINKTGKVTGPIAYHLTRVLTGTGIDGKPMSPSPSLSEQLEAAVALCRLRSESNSPYQAELSLYLVGRFITKSLIKEYNADANAFPAAVVKKDAAKAMRVRAEPWKLHATRLEHALDDLAATTRSPKEQRTARQLLENAQTVFKQMQGLKKVEVNNALIDFVNNLKPKGNLLFKGLEETKVPLDTVRDDDD
jgi:hypothetical protein